MTPSWMRFGLLGLVALAATASPAAVSGKDLRIVVPDSMRDLEACHMAASAVSRVIQLNVSEGLINRDAEGVLQPRLATEWEQVNPSTYRFKLREGVTFHDGSAFNAASVKHTLERMVLPELECETGRKFFGGITLTTNIVDDYTIEISADPAQEILLILLAQVAMVPASMSVTERVLVPVGTGPYKIASVEGAGQLVTLERFDQYWGEAPEADRVIYTHRPDTSVAAAMVEVGEADLAPYITRADATNPETDVSYLNTDTRYISFSKGTPPLDDVRVRKAISLALNREAFIGTVLGEGSLPSSQVVLPFITGYNSDLQPWPYDPDQARALLAEAKADGVPVDTEIILNASTVNFATSNELPMLVSAMLNEVGFNTRVQMVEHALFVDSVNAPFPEAEGRQPGLYFRGHDNSTGDAGTSLRSKYSSMGGQNEFTDETLDNLITTGLAQGGDERAATFAKAFEYIQQTLVSDAQLFHMVSFARVGPAINWQPDVLTLNMIPVENITFK